MAGTDLLWPDAEPLDPELPALILLHGFTGCAAIWNDVADQLRGQFNCVAFELPGHGRNTAALDSRAFTFQGLIDQICRLLDELGIDRVHLWGYSLGGRIALHLALAVPDRIDHLVLESTSPGMTDSVARENRRQQDQQLADSIIRDGLDGFVAGWMAQPLFASQQSLPVARQQQGRELRMRNSPEGLAAALRSFSLGAQETLADRLEELSMPVMILTGARDGKFSDIGRAMAGSIPRAQLCILSDVGHAPHWEAPANAADVVRRFLLEQRRT